jgi:hypothetical protein
MFYEKLVTLLLRWRSRLEDPLGQSAPMTSNSHQLDLPRMNAMVHFTPYLHLQGPLPGS